MGDTYPKLRVGAVQAAPDFLKREGTVAKACDLIREAGRRGVQLLAFPEGFIPGHPQWYAFHSVGSRRSFKFARELFKNSVTIPGPEMDVLCTAAREAGVYVVMGCCEKEPGSMGTMYNTLFAIDQRGRLVGRRRKIMPTLGERLVHAAGFGDSVRVFESDFGPISALICGENLNPLLVFALQALGSRIHVASWPAFYESQRFLMQDIIPSITRTLAFQCGVFVVSSVMAVSEEMIDVLPASAEDREFLVQLSKRGGGASVVAPSGTVIAGPMGEGEGMVHADVDLEVAINQKLAMDFAGHYNRPDIFTLNVNRSVPQYLRTEDGSRVESHESKVPSHESEDSRPVTRDS